MPKRKHSSTGKYKKQGKSKKPRPNAQGIVPGYTRNVGAYGRALAKGVERKYFETSIVNVADVSAGGLFDSLNKVPQNTTDITRIGNKIVIRSIHIKAQAGLDNQIATQPLGGTFRYILYVDHQANGATAAVTDILKTAAITSFRNLDQIDRFTILADKIMTVNPTAVNGTSTNDAPRPWSLNKKVNIPVHFSGIAGAITEMRSNNIGLLYISSVSFVNAATIGTCRIRFTDE